ncbi:unnamed protein product [Allacma fusca]|uniref:Endothelin-converting enzyme 1 n=1 Tax=Allacma fusca TaxID=39272 RepID=A0A8J2P5S0_9HEXA|nr:unnamed protein product [Allacma fusca]
MSDSGEGFQKKAMVVHHHNHHHEVESTTRTTLQGSNCTGREKALTLCVVLLAIFSFGLLAFIVVSWPLSSLIAPDWSEDINLLGSGVCDSKECVEISYRAIQAGDFRADPCDDFYHFACSRWQAANPITTEQFFHAANINLIKDRVDAHIKQLLEVPNVADEVDKQGRKKFRIEKNVKAFYHSCLNFVNPDENLLIADLLNSVGGYQWSDTWSEGQFDLTNATLKFLWLSAAPLFDVMLDIDAKNRSRFALIVDLPRPTSLVPSLFHSTTAPDQDYLFHYESILNRPKVHDDGDPTHFKFSNNQGNSNGSNGKSVVDRHTLYKMITDNIEVKKMHQLKNLIRKVCLMMNATEEECHADINAITLIVTQIQKAVAAKSTDPGSSGDGSGGGSRGPVNWNDLAGTVYVPYPDYLRRLFTYIQFTNKRLLYNSMLMVYVRDMLNDLMDKGKESTTSSSPSASSSSTGKPPEKDEEPRWKFCVHATKSVFAMELSSLYLRSFDPKYLKRVRTDVEEIFVNVKESLKSFLNRSTWLEKISRMNAIRKIETLKGNFLAPSFYFREDYLDDSIKGIQIHPTDFLSNVRVVYKTFRQQLYRIFRSEVNEDRATWAFVTFPFIVNAFYIQQFNSIVIPLAFLTPPQYTWGAPKYINYATVALTIAHEALHALDGSGSDFDADGKLQEWVSDSRGFLREKSSCVAKQYSENFHKLIPFYQTHVPIQVDGNLTQNENMADIAGLQVAFNAYINYRTSLSKEELREAELKLPGFNSTLEQVFFLTVAQAYCANISPMGYVFLLEMDEHTPHPERINGMLMNIPEFSRTFHCPVGSPMNPVQKCSLW